MMADLRYPLLYQINTRVWLTDWSRSLGKRATPDRKTSRSGRIGVLDRISGLPDLGGYSGNII